VDNSVIYENLGALEFGVIVPTCNINDELLKMSATDARIAKRKWRKRLRKARKMIKNSPSLTPSESNDPSNITQDKSLIKFHARRELRCKGELLLGKKR
jgi:hypothetical protein